MHQHIDRFTKKKSSNIKYIDIPIDTNIPFDKIPKQIPTKNGDGLISQKTLNDALTNERTCTIEPLKSFLGANSLTQFGDNILQGTATLDGLGLTNLQKIYFFKKLKNNQEHYIHRYHLSYHSQI